MAKKKRIKAKVTELEKDFKDQFAIYQKSQEVLAGFEGKEWKEIGKDNVNKMLNDIQKNFLELYPIIEFIQGYHTPATQMLKVYTDFVNSLKAQGVVLTKEPTAKA